MKKVIYLVYIFICMNVCLSLLWTNSIKANNLTGAQQMEKILEEKKETGKVNLPAYVIGEDDGELSEDEETWKAHKAIYDRLTERQNEVRQYIKPNPNIEIIENKTNTNLNSIIKNNNIYVIISIVIMVLLLILSLVLKRKEILFGEIFILALIIVIVVNNIFKHKSNSEISDKEKNRIIKYLNGEIQDKKLDDYANKYKIDYIDKFNEKEVDLSKVINDYIIKCYYCIKRKANNKELYSQDLEVLNCFEEKSHKYDFTYERRYVDVLDWEKIDNWQVVNNILSKESMQGIYDSLTDKDIENYKDGLFLDKLIERIDSKIESKNEFDAYSIIPYDYFRIFRLDIEPLYKCKYYYLDKGEDTTIELPYGATLKYEPARLEERDIREWENVNIKKLKHDPEGEKTLFAYYMNSKNEKQGIFTTIYDNGQYNKYEITNNVRYAHININSNIKNNTIVSKDVGGAVKK